VTSPLRIAVVGHTNAGKTSLLRTLARSRDFGDVSPSPATTRRVEPISLRAGGVEAILLLDTPGLEDSIGLLEAIDAAAPSREGKADSIERFLASDEATGRFSQEAKALEAARAADLLLAVIDARDRVLPRHLDELELLSRCGRPLVPVLNFIASPAAAPAAWRDALARLGLHAVAEFDTVVFEADGESRLFEKIRTLAEPHRDAIDRLLAERARDRRDRRQAAARAIADLLLDSATLIVEVDPGTSEEHAAVDRLRELVRQRERRGHRELLSIAGFAADDAAVAEAALDSFEVGVDLFSPEALKAAGFSAASGAAAGAALGAAIDLAVGGISLGAAAGLGAMIGGVLGATGRQARKLVMLAKGGREASAGDPTLLLLLHRGTTLAKGLERRGHASIEPLPIEPSGRADLAKDPRRAEPILAALRTARERLPVRVVAGGRFDESSASPSVLRSRLRDELSEAIKGLIEAS
jgi:hypothetical protein